MNERKLTQKRRENFKKLEYMAYNPHINCTPVNTNQSYSHYYVGCVVDWMLAKGVPANVLPDFWEEDNRDDIESFIKKHGQRFRHKWERPQIVSEAIFSTKLRADRFVLDTGEIIEIAESEDQSSLDKKHKLYNNMGLEFVVVKI